MKFALSLLALVACAHAIPITKDIRTQTTQVDTPTLIVGSSQVDSKSDGKVTLHLDQRSRIPEPQVDTWTVASVPKTEQVRQTLPQTVKVVEQPKQEPVLTARNEIVSPKTEETIRVQPVETVRVQPEETIIRVQPAETIRVKTVLDARNEAPIRTSEPVITQEVPIIRQVVEPQVVQQVVPTEQKPVLVVEQVPVVQAIQERPVVFVVPDVPVQIPVVEIPQTVVEPIFVPEIPQPVAIVPVLEERATPVVVQTSPVVESIVKTVVKESVEPQVKVVPKQVDARNLKVDQAPVRAPIVLSAIQKQAPVVVAKTEVPKQVVAQETRLEGKNAIVQEIKPQVVVPVSVPVTVPKVVLEERKSEVTIIREEARPIREEVRPIRVEPLAVPEQAIRKEPVVIPVVQPQEPAIRTEPIREPVQIRPIQTVSEPVVRSEPRVPIPDIRESVQRQPVQVEPLVVVTKEIIRKEPTIIRGAEPKETSIRTTEPVIQKPVQPVVVESIRRDTVPVVVAPVVQSQQTNRPTETRKVVQSFPEEKTQ